MSILNIVKTVKEIHKEDIVFVKIGKFYQVYGKDAYVMSYLFEYKLKKVEEIYMCGFDRDWTHFFELRDKPYVDPQMYDLAHNLHSDFKKI